MPIGLIGDEIHVGIIGATMNPSYVGIQSAAVFEIFRTLQRCQHVGQRHSPNDVAFAIEMPIAVTPSRSPHNSGGQRLHFAIAGG